MTKKPQQDTLSHDELHELFKLMENPMISFNCGELCRDAAEGTPYCCDHSNFHPLLFSDEYEWLKAHRGAEWEPFEPKTRLDKREVKSLSDHLLYANCPGIENCNRDNRALVCRFFPFEPHLDADGKVEGLAFITNDPMQCPLVKKPLETFNREYIDASIKVWQKIVDTYPAERDLYIAESRKREKRSRKKKRPFRILK